MAYNDEIIFHFEEFKFDPKRLNLSLNSKTLPLKRQSAEVLALLLKSPGEIVTREEIRQQIWADRTIDFDHGINAAIRDIRQALGDDSRSPTFIGTQSKVGYKFLKTVLTKDQSSYLTRLKIFAAIGILALGTFVASMATNTGGNGPAPGQKPRLGIMPIAYEQVADPPLALADKWTGVIVRTLAENQDSYLVISAGELFGEDRPDPTQADMSKWFQVDYILAGTLITSTSRRTINLRLIRTEGYVHIWAKTIEFDQDLPAAFLPLIAEITNAAH